MNIISYSLYGCEIRYTEPLIWNSKNLNSFYKGWILRVYHDDSVPDSILKTLYENGVQLINIKDTSFSYFSPKFWRFIPVFEKDIQAFIVRDSDSIFSTREVSLVNEWNNSKSEFHILRDHPLHISPILAGMFGIKKHYFSIFSKELLKQKSLVSSKLYNADQIFLADHIYEKISTNCTVHTSYFAFKNENFVRIMKNTDDNNFIGSVYIDHNKLIDTIINYDFMIGVPFWIAKLLRYKIRPVLYLSYFYDRLVHTIQTKSSS